MEHYMNPVIDYEDGVGRVQKGDWIARIIEVCADFDVETDRLLVYDYGEHGDLKLVMWVDDDLDLRIETDQWQKDDSLEFVDRRYVPINDAEEIELALNELWAGVFYGVD